MEFQSVGSCTSFHHFTQLLARVISSSGIVYQLYDEHVVYISPIAEVRHLERTSKVLKLCIISTTAFLVSSPPIVIRNEQC